MVYHLTDCINRIQSSVFSEFYSMEKTIKTLCQKLSNARINQKFDSKLGWGLIHFMEILTMNSTNSLSTESFFMFSIEDEIESWISYMPVKQCLTFFHL